MKEILFLCLFPLLLNSAQGWANGWWTFDNLTDNKTTTTPPPITTTPYWYDTEDYNDHVYEGDQQPSTSTASTPSTATPRNWDDYDDNYEYEDDVMTTKTTTTSQPRYPDRRHYLHRLFNPGRRPPTYAPSTTTTREYWDDEDWYSYELKHTAASQPPRATSTTTTRKYWGDKNGDGDYEDEYQTSTYPTTATRRRYWDSNDDEYKFRDGDGQMSDYDDNYGDHKWEYTPEPTPSDYEEQSYPNEYDYMGFATESNVNVKQLRIITFAALGVGGVAVLSVVIAVVAFSIAHARRSRPTYSRISGETGDSALNVSSSPVPPAAGNQKFVPVIVPCQGKPSQPLPEQEEKKEEEEDDKEVNLIDV